ncbi:MAG: hypothetical protein AAB819_03180 [Patescibacteria group bacterium]
MTIDVDRVEENETQFVFEILLDENDRVPPFTVTVDKSYYEHLTGGSVSPEMLVEKSFVFLVEREPREAILREFNLTYIARYFPEYETEIKKYFAG